MSEPDIIAQLRSDGSALCVEAAAEIQRLRDQLEYARESLVIIKGTLEEQRHEDEPFRIEHDIPPNAPR